MLAFSKLTNLGYLINILSESNLEGWKAILLRAIIRYLYYPFIYCWQNDFSWLFPQIIRYKRHYYYYYIERFYCCYHIIIILFAIVYTLFHTLHNTYCINYFLFVNNLFDWKCFNYKLCFTAFYIRKFFCINILFFTWCF